MESNNNNSNKNDSHKKYDQHHPYFGIITSSKLLTSDYRDCKKVLEFTVSVKDDELTHWVPGDAFGLITPNKEDQIKTILDKLKLKGNELIKLSEKISKKPHFSRAPQQTSGHCYLLDILKYCVSFHFIPKKIFFKTLAESCPPDSKDQKELLFLCSKDGVEKYRKNWLKPPNPSLFFIFSSFPSCQITSELLIEVLPPLAPRYYSLNSSCKLMKNEVGFTVWVLENGHTSQWLDFQFLKMEKKEETELLPLFKRNSSFIIKSDLEVPIILAGGIVPFRVFLQEREIILKENLNFKNEVWLFYGCRYEKRDFLYSKELYNWKENKTITKLFLAFSRDQKEKIYIQDKMMQVSDEFIKILENPKTNIFLCSDTKGISESLESTFKIILQTKGNSQNSQNAKEFLNNMKKEGRYLIDNWC